MSKFHFSRMQEDGRLGPVINPGYDTKEDAKANARNLLRLRGAAKIVLVEVIEGIEVTANVRFVPISTKPQSEVRRG